MMPSAPPCLARRPDPARRHRLQRADPHGRPPQGSMYRGADGCRRSWPYQWTRSCPVAPGPPQRRSGTHSSRPGTRRRDRPSAPPANVATTPRDIGTHAPRASVLPSPAPRTDRPGRSRGARACFPLPSTHLAATPHARTSPRVCTSLHARAPTHDAVCAGCLRPRRCHGGHRIAGEAAPRPETAHHAHAPRPAHAAPHAPPPRRRRRRPALSAPGTVPSGVPRARRPSPRARLSCSGPR